MDFRFLSLDKVIAPMATAMQVPPEHVRAYMEDIRQSTEPVQRQPAGVYLGVFALCPEADSKLGPKIIVSKSDTCKIPSVYLWGEEAHGRFESTLAEWDGMSSCQVLAAIREGSYGLDEDCASFCRTLRRAIHELAQTLNEDFFAHATFSSRCVQVSVNAQNGKKAYHSMITFCIIPDIHNSLRSAGDVKLVSYNFFRCQQQTREIGRAHV